MTLTDEKDTLDDGGSNFNNSKYDDYDDRKIFLSRVPQTFDEESVRRIFQEKFGENSVVDVVLLYERDKEETAEDGGNNVNGGNGTLNSKDTTDKKCEEEREKEKTMLQHRGFGFVTFDCTETRDGAISTRTVRGSAKPTSKRKHTMYIRPVVRDESFNGCVTVEEGDGENKEVDKRKNLCHLWSMHRCPYGDKCKFLHEGDGGCLPSSENGNDTKGGKRKQKCFTFKKKGKCKLGDKCPFSHDSHTHPKATDNQKKDDNEDEADSKNDKTQNDCINWKTKGKCRKKDRGCPYRHDEDVKRAALSKIELKERKRARNDAEDHIKEKSDQKKERNDKKRQPLSVRVFGLNYDTTEEDVRSYFEHCGTIVELTFPTFEDSGRSKGYCGILFQSPKAVEQAVLLDGQELHGRWLSIQEGKMYLRQWEEHHQASGEKAANTDTSENEINPNPLTGEYGQKVKRRKKHGYKE